MWVKEDNAHWKPQKLSSQRARHNLVFNLNVVDGTWLLR